MKSSIAMLSLAAILLCTPPALAGEMYYWTDANGVRQFSDVPPEGQVRYEHAPLQNTSPAPSSKPATAGAAVAGGQPEATPPAAADSAEKPLPAAKQRLIDNRQQLTEEHNQLVKVGEGIQETLTAASRGPSNLRRKKSRQVATEITDYNQQIAAYNRKVKAFNDNPVRFKYRVSELSEMTPVPFPKYAKE